MGKAGKIAKNAKNGKVGQLNNKKTLVKAKTTMGTKSPLKNPPKKSCGPKITPKCLSKESEDDDEANKDDVEENEEDSGAEICKTENGDSENVDSDNEDQEEEEDEINDDSDDENVQQNQDNNSDDENDSDDDAPDEKAIDKKTQGPMLRQKKKKEKLDKNQNQDRRVYVNRLDANTTDSHVKEYFSKCGEIESVKLSKGHRFKQDAVIVFKDASSCEKALKLHNTILNDSTILVDYAKSTRPKSDEERSIIMLNSDNLTKLEGSVITEIFSECGEIDHFNVVCEKNVLAYITFKEASAVPKALELSGTTQNEIKVEVSPYRSKIKPQKTKIFVKNIANGVTEDDLTKMFEVCGAVVKVSLKRNNNAMATAIVQFENEDGYCKSFLLHEEKFRGRSLFIEPFSQPKKFGQNNFNGKGKRPAHKQWKGGPQKKFQKAD